MYKAIVCCSLLTVICACAPAVGTPGWCKAMDKKDKVTEWTIADATDYAKHCVFE